MEEKTRLTCERLKAARAAAKMSFQDLSNATGLSKSVLQRYESGNIQKLPIDRLEMIAKALGLNILWDGKIKKKSRSNSIKNYFSF